MSVVNVPINPVWTPLMECGSKTTATFPDRYGEVGDVFEADGHRYVITNVVCMSMYAAVHIFHHDEGFDEWTDMRDWILQHHPDLANNDQVYVHEYEMVPEGVRV